MGSKPLTDKQQEIVTKRGLFVVKACPGSGKTFTVAARMAALMKECKDTHRGIAVVSFTNIAWQEVEKYLCEDFGISVPVSYPHFLGTIDSFLNRYVFLPFGHLVMGCKERPQLIGPPANNWEPVGAGKMPWGHQSCYMGCKLNQFSYDKEGNLIKIFDPMKAFDRCNLKHVYCQKLKTQIVKAGYATQRDANYFAMKVLESYSKVAGAIAYRFPFIIMDEAQDTSDVEMQTVDVLIENGLREAMLVGDPEQSIYEWRDAKPELLEEKYKKWENNSIPLNESWRSSQKICDFFHKMSNSQEAPVAKNEDVRECKISPEIWTYDGEIDRKILERFQSFCKENNVVWNSANVAVLARGKDLVSTIQGHESTEGLSPWQNELTRGICESKFLFDGGQLKEGFNRLERTVCEKLLQKDYCTSREVEEVVRIKGFLAWRKEIYGILCELPKVDCLLGEWVLRANEKLKMIKNAYFNAEDLKLKRGKNKGIYENLTFESLFGRQRIPLEKEGARIGTVHSVKGETFEAVLVILKEGTVRRKKYSDLLQQLTLACEELRIVYVAITRPKRVLVLAVPQGELKAWETKFSM